MTAAGTRLRAGWLIPSLERSRTKMVLVSMFASTACEGSLFIVDARKNALLDRKIFGALAISQRARPPVSFVPSCLAAALQNSVGKLEDLEILEV